MGYKISNTQYRLLLFIYYYLFIDFTSVYELKSVMYEAKYSRMEKVKLAEHSL